MKVPVWSDELVLPNGSVGEVVVQGPVVTADAWRGGWFHTGDVALLEKDGTIRFVDRKKNIIRRSGENISAAEVEAVLDRHPGVERSGVIAIPDPVREQEVLAFVQLKSGRQAGQNIADALAAWCTDKMAYYKAPGWIHFVAEQPMTGSNKVQKGALIELGRKLDTHELFDTRAFKQRQASAKTI